MAHFTLNRSSAHHVESEIPPSPIQIWGSQCPPSCPLCVSPEEHRAAAFTSMGVWKEPCNCLGSAWHDGQRRDFDITPSLVCSRNMVLLLFSALSVEAKLVLSTSQGCCGVKRQSV